MLLTSTGSWFLPILASALCLGFYDICKKHAVRENAVMPVLFFATLSGSGFFIAGAAVTGNFAAFAACTPGEWILVLLKSCLVAASWIYVYYAMRDLPISIASPIRASAPLWTFLGGVVLFHEIPSWLQGCGMFLIFVGYYAFSLLGKQEGISFRRHRGMHRILIGTLLGAGSALYDKYLLGILGLPRETVQFWFSVDLVFILGAVCFARHHLGAEKFRFEWRWSIVATGILLIIADWLYFYAVSLPESQISILSLVRRCNCIVAFFAGSIFFHDRNLRSKAVALALILLGVFLLAAAK